LSRSGLHAAAILLLVAAFVLHNDLWLWNDPSNVLGLPVGLLYHIALCLAASAIFALLLRTGPPATGDAERGPRP